MRQIKFRAWHKEIKKMFPVLTWHNDGMVELEKDKGLHLSSRVEIMQYTGLKDKNNRDIFEGDIIDYNDVGSLMASGIYEIEYIGAGFYPLTSIDGEAYDYPKKWAVDKTCEVLGNRFENKKLLK